MTNVNEHVGVLEEKNGYAIVVDQLTSESGEIGSAAGAKFAR